jgi:hypothetical protein
LLLEVFAEVLHAGDYFDAHFIHPTDLGDILRFAFVDLCCWLVQLVLQLFHNVGLVCFSIVKDGVDDDAFGYDSGLLAQNIGTVDNCLGDFFDLGAMHPERGLYLF